MCGNLIHIQANLTQYLFSQDGLCQKCRIQWIEYDGCFKIQELQVHSLFVYNEALSSALRQYKECMDEALAPIFLSPYLKALRRQYAHCVLVGMPSSKNKREERGFNHIELMFSALNLPFLDCLVKTEDIKQAKQSKKDRLKIGEIIALKPEFETRKLEHIILVDDIVTTGSTLLAANQCLQGKANKIEALTMCTHPFLVEKRRVKLFDWLIK